MNEQADYYAKVYKSFIELQDLTYQAKIVYICLKVYINDKFQCWPSYRLICHDLGMTDKTVAKYLDELIKKGYIKREEKRKNGQTFTNNIYTILK